MLAADAGGSSILDLGLSYVAEQLVDGSPDIPAREVGPYRLIRLIGEGGMGTVHLAERKDAGNPVAMKFLLHAGLSPARRERFATEIKLLGKLNHPAIARLYDAGTLPDGTPWFVMEYVDGTRLVEYCREHKLPARAVMQLFLQICGAVQYAHGQEIIHRDLKPSNIMVDRHGAPRLLDFGVAKELHALEVEGDSTRSGLRLLTPQYAAPEWMQEGIVGPYTDVYSLGVILYQLLAGELPIKEAQRPSLAPGRLKGLKKVEWDDLDKLCSKAMQPDYRERYASVEALARDVDHYLKNEPLEAQPPRFGYRLGKFVSRNRRSVVAASVIFLLFCSMATWFTLRLAAERNQALLEAARTRRIQRFTLGLFGDDERASGPSKDMKVITLLDEGARKVEVLRADPESQGQMYQTLSEMYRKLGDPAKASRYEELGLQNVRATAGADSLEAAQALGQMALLRSDEAKYKEADALVVQALQIAGRHSDASDLAVLKVKAAAGEVWVQNHSFQKAAEMLDPIVKFAPSGEEGSLILLESLTALEVAEQGLGHYDRARTLGRQLIDTDQRVYGDSHPRLAYDYANLGAIEAVTGRFPEAEAMYRNALRLFKSWYSETQPDYLAVKSILATILTEERKLDEAEALLKSVLPLQEQTFGPQHPYVCFTLNALGALAMTRKDYRAAQDYKKRAFEMSRTLYGDKDFNTAITEADFSDAYVAEGEYARAEPLLREAVNIMNSRPMPGNMSVGLVDVKYGHVLVKLKHYKEAEKPLTLGYAVLMSKKVAAYTRQMERARQDLATLYKALGQPQKLREFSSN